MLIEEIRLKIRNNQYVYTLHAGIERKADDLTFYQVEEAVLNGMIPEQYPDTGRGKAVLSQDFPKIFRFILSADGAVMKSRSSLFMFRSLRNSDIPGQEERKHESEKM